MLDQQNPRFVRIASGDPGSIRKYMATYEDVCSLAGEINTNKGLLLGERIVVIQENGQNIVMEGNRRTCSLQFLLDRGQIPNGFEHRIPIASADTLINIGQIEVDVAPNRDYAVNLMSKRHIAGVKQWKPLAKKRFFAGMFMNGNSISHLSSITGISVSSIRKDIRDYKFLLAASGNYKIAHPEFDEDIITYTIDPFLRIFVARQQTPEGLKAPSEILKLRYDNQENTLSDLPNGIFNQIVELVFNATIVERRVTTRGTLFDVSGVESLLESVPGSPCYGSTPTPPPTPNDDNQEGTNTDRTGQEDPSSEDTIPARADNPGDDSPSGGTDTQSNENDGDGHEGEPRGNGPASGGPTGGGAAPATFFEHISWEGKLIPGNRDHDGLIAALNELYLMSRNITRKDNRTLKVYEAYHIAAGMLLRTVYEQALILQLKNCRPQLWIDLKAEFTFPMLSNIENKISTNIALVMPNRDMVRSFNFVKLAHSRDFLNANIHNPGLIRATPASLVGLANSGMVSLIQLIINAI